MKGLTNIGNTCYFNATMQCLLQIPLLSNHMILNQYFGECDFTCEFRRLTRKFWLKSDVKAVIDTREIMRIFRNKFRVFDNGDEQDAQECLLSILDTLEKSKERIIKDNFYTDIVKTVVYPGGKSETSEKSMCIMLHPSRNCSLCELIENFNGKEEIVEGYIDDKNNKYNLAAIKTQIKELPNVAIFCFNMFIQKFLIDIPKRIGNHKLIALCIHQGTLHGGHYVAITRHKNKWYLKDDEGVRILQDDITFEKLHCYFCIFKNSSN